jgi:hypothetical protein
VDAALPELWMMFVVLCMVPPRLVKEWIFPRGKMFPLDALELGMVMHESVGDKGPTHVKLTTLDQVSPEDLTILLDIFDVTNQTAKPFGERGDC